MMIDSSAGLTGRVVGFCRFVRAHGLNVGVQETLDALEASRLGTFVEQRTFKTALRALFCSAPEERALFDRLFASYWQEHVDAPGRPARQRIDRPVTRAHRQVPLLLIAAAAAGETPEEQGKGTTGASAVERLRKTDFSRVPVYDQERLEQLALRLWKQMSLRLARRLRTARERRQVDLRRTLRHSIPHGGDPIELSYRGRKRRKPRLVLLLDVSGSMDPYSFFLLRFVYALQRHFTRVDSFVFSTRLTCISDALKARRLPDSLSALADAAEAWSSGTRIGACLQTFNETYARRLLSKDTLVVLLSDGLDTGEPALLAQELDRIRRRARKLIWLNPLLGMDGYEPLARGIRAALPHIDVFLSAHNLESLLHLETHLSHV